MLDDGRWMFDFMVASAAAGDPHMAAAPNGRRRGAARGHVLVQGPGIFHEHLMVTNSIRLIGTNSPMIDGDGRGTPLILAAPGVEVRGIIDPQLRHATSRSSTAAS